MTEVLGASLMQKRCVVERAKQLWAVEPVARLPTAAEQEAAGVAAAPSALQILMSSELDRLYDVAATA